MQTQYFPSLRCFSLLRWPMEQNAGHTAIPCVSGGSVCGQAAMASLARSCSMTSVASVEETTPAAQRWLEPSIKKGNVREPPSTDLNKTFSSVTQSCPTLCDPMDCNTLGLPVYHQLPEFTQTHVHWVGDAIQPSHPLLPLLLLPSIFPSIRVFSNESALLIGGQSIGASASASVLPMNIQDWFPLG